MFENNVVTPEKKLHLWKNGIHTFTIYRHSPKLINVTGLKSAEEIEQQKYVMEEKF